LLPTTGFTLQPIRTVHVVVSACRPKKTKSDHFGHQNGSTRSRCPGHLHWHARSGLSAFKTVRLDGQTGVARPSGRPIRTDSRGLTHGPNLSQVCGGPDSAPVSSLSHPGPSARSGEFTPKPVPAPNPRSTSSLPSQVAPLHAVGANVAATTSRRILLASSHVPVSPSSVGATDRD
jgi:hypothetical protein